jgi:hypothetical protein
MGAFNVLRVSGVINEKALKSKFHFDVTIDLTMRNQDDSASGGLL